MFQALNPNKEKVLADVALQIYNLVMDYQNRFLKDLQPWIETGYVEAAMDTVDFKHGNQRQLRYLNEARRILAIANLAIAENKTFQETYNKNKKKTLQQLPANAGSNPIDFITNADDWLLPFFTFNNHTFNNPAFALGYECPHFLGAKDKAKTADIYQYFNPFEILHADKSKPKLIYGWNYFNTVHKQISAYTVGTISRSQALANIYTQLFELRFGIETNRHGYKVIQPTIDSILAKFEEQIALDAQNPQNQNYDDANQLFAFIMIKRIALEEEQASSKDKSHILYEHFIEEPLFRQRIVFQKDNYEGKKEIARKLLTKAQENGLKIRKKLEKARQAVNAASKIALNDTLGGDAAHFRTVNASNLIVYLKDFFLLAQKEIAEARIQAAQEQVRSAEARVQAAEDQMTALAHAKTARSAAEVELAKTEYILQQCMTKIVKIQEISQLVLTKHEELPIVQLLQWECDNKISSQENATIKLSHARYTVQNQKGIPTDLNITNESILEIERLTLEACQIAADLSDFAIEQAKLNDTKANNIFLENFDLNQRKKVEQYLRCSFLGEFDPAVSYQQDFENLYRNTVEQRTQAIREHLDNQSDLTKLKTLQQAHTKVAKIHKVMTSVAPKIFDTKQVREDMLISEILNDFSNYIIEPKFIKRDPSRFTQITTFFRPAVNVQANTPITLDTLIEKLKELEHALVTEDKGKHIRHAKSSKLYQLTYSSIEKLHSTIKDNTPQANSLKEIWEQAQKDNRILNANWISWLWNKCGETLTAVAIAAP